MAKNENDPHKRMKYLKLANADRNEELLKYGYYTEAFEDDPNNGHAYLGVLDIDSATKCFRKDPD